MFGLVGGGKSKDYQRCIETWSKCMPDFEIIEWTQENLPEEILNHRWVKSAIECRKWAYATDVIRLWLLKTYGGIYIDTDVMVYRSFVPFLNDRAFSCLEFNPNEYISSIKKRKKEIIGIGIEAGILGAEKGHPWIEDILSYYDNLSFINKPSFYCHHIMPRVINRVSIKKYGFIPAPIFQKLSDGVKIYPAETFSWIFNWKYLGMDYSQESLSLLGAEMPMRYACHLTLHAWWDGLDGHDTLKYKIKHYIYNLFKGKLSRARIRKFKTKLLRQKTW